MLKIAVCDDDNYLCKELHEYILEYDVHYEIDLKTNLYHSCNKLFERLSEDEKYDLLFLDIEFPDMNGIELGNKIRKILKNTKIQIVFISAKQDYAMELFDIQPFNFMVKPLRREKVFSCISQFLNYYNDNCDFFSYTLENIKHSIAINEIIYFKSNKKKVIMHTETSNIEFYAKFSELLSGDLKRKFVVIKRGLAVNIHHIKHSNFNSLILSDNTTFEIARDRCELVRERL